jgi:DNA-binding NarL/FixJ family response regulator
MPVRPQRVVIIDDHPEFRAAARELLERRGFTVVGDAGGAKAGIEAVENVAPDAVLLDIQLPDGNGIDVCRTLTTANPELVVLLVSADAQGGRWASDCGAVGFVPKARLATADLTGLLGGGDEASGRATG